MTLAPADAQPVADLEIARRALKNIEHATAPGDDGGYHEAAYTLAHRALSDLKWGTVNGAAAPAQDVGDRPDFDAVTWNENRSEWLIETLMARDFEIAEFHAMQVDIAARWRTDRTELTRLRAALADAEDDVKRLHKEKMDEYEARVATNARADAMAKDAERYRWMADNYDDIRAILNRCSGLDVVVAIDEAIDAASKP